MIQSSHTTFCLWNRRLLLTAVALLAAVVWVTPLAHAVCSTGTTVGVGSCPSLPDPGCCASASVVQWCEGGDWCELDCAANSEGLADTCQVNFTNSCCDRCETWDDAAFCQCDDGCEGYGDCCEDYGSLCAVGDSSFCSWKVSATFSGYDCGSMPTVEPTGTYPYTCGTGDGPGCSCLNKQCGDDGCGNSCGACLGGATCDASGSCQCAGTCLGKTCGDDGCGNSCGVCPAGQFCISGACEGSCSADCVGKNCGGDGCGGECGVCLSDQTCSPDGVCVAGCQADCVGKLCGDDGCGESCGTCAGDQTCNLAGQCEAACGANCLGKQCGDDGCGGSCGSCPQGSCQEGLCVSGCIGACGSKECGPDGCGGSCGGCSSDEVCSDLGICGPGCAPQCQGRQCGNDGCGGSCGVCDASSYCGPLGSCIDSGGADVPGSTPENACPEGSYWNALVAECVADDGTHLAVNREVDGDSGCGGSGGSTSWVLVLLALLAWRSRARMSFLAR
jgi:hypothetical protein